MISEAAVAGVIKFADATCTRGESGGAERGLPLAWWHLIPARLPVLHTDLTKGQLSYLRD